MQSNSQDHRSFQLGIGFAFAMLLGFLTFSLLSMVVYPGGTNHDPSMKSYAFTENFFSDLGRVTTFSGGPNTASSVFFVVALLMGACGQFIYLSLKWKVLAEKTRVFTLLGCISGLLTVVGQIGVAVTPWDIMGATHMNFVYVLFFSFLVSVVFFMLAIFTTPEYPKVYGWILTGFTLMLMGYVGLLLAGPNPETSLQGLWIQATGQKIIVYAHVTVIGLQLLGLRHMHQKTQNARGFAQSEESGKKRKGTLEVKAPC